MRKPYILAAAVIATAVGCTTQTYAIKASELSRIAALPPEVRGTSVRVEQELTTTTTEHQTAVTSDTQVLFLPRVVVTPNSNPPTGARPRPGRGGVGGTGGGIGRSGSGSGAKLADDGKAAAIAALAIAATAIVVVAVVEADRFEGDVALHPMHPVHLFLRDGQYTVLPLAHIDANTAAWTQRAVVRRNEGPWRELQRAPLSREGWTYGVMFGGGTLRSADGGNGGAFAGSIELGHFFNQQFGATVFGQFSWRDNRAKETIFEQRYGAQLQFMPLQAGIINLGVYGAAGWGVRGEDGVPNYNRTSGITLQGGLQAQLDINTHVAITARAGAVQAYGDQVQELLVGMSVY